MFEILKTHNSKKNACIVIINFVQKTVSAQHEIFIQHVKSAHSYDILNIFKNGFASSDQKKTIANQKSLKKIMTKI